MPAAKKKTKNNAKTKPNKQLESLITTMINENKLNIVSGSRGGSDATTTPPPALEHCFEVLEAFAQDPHPYVITASDTAKQLVELRRFKQYLMADEARTSQWKEDLKSLAQSDDACASVIQDRFRQEARGSFSGGAACDNSEDVPMYCNVQHVLRIYFWVVAQIAVRSWPAEVKETQQQPFPATVDLVKAAVKTCFDAVSTVVSHFMGRQLVGDLPKLVPHAALPSYVQCSVANFACNMDAIEESTVMAVYRASMQELEAAWGYPSAEHDVRARLAFPLAMLSLQTMKHRGWEVPETAETNTSQLEQLWHAVSLGLKTLNLDVRELHCFGLDAILPCNIFLDKLDEAPTCELARVNRTATTNRDINATALEMFWGLSHCELICSLDWRSPCSNLQPQTSQALAKLLTLIPPSEWDTVPAVAHRTEATDAKNVSELRDGQLRWRWHLGSTVNQLLEFIQKKRCRKNAYLKEGKLNLVWESARHQMYLEITLLRWRLQSIVVSTPNTASEGTTVLLCRDVVLVILSYVHDAHWLSSPKNFFKRLIV